MKILIVDDDKPNLYVLDSLLRGNGYEVEFALDGAEALEKARQQDFDLIISDILMPRMDGFQFCREVKSDEQLKLIPFVFYTATYTDAKDEAFALSLGAEKFVIKPQEPDVFVEILKQVIEARKAGLLVPVAPVLEEEAVYLKVYNQRLITKLEDKMMELESANKGLRESEKQLREAGERLQALSRRVIEVQEQERRHLAYELHDEIGQFWTAIKLTLEAAIQDNDLEAVHRFCQEASRVADQAIQRARALSVDLRPSVLDDFGLDSALRWFLDRQGRQAGLKIQLRADPSLGRLPPTIEITCFRIVQEAVTNIIRHARAHNVTVEVGQREDDLKVTIKDDGIGFDVEAARERATRGESLGLLSMQERALLVGGALEIRSTPGAGTELLLRLPVRA
jgi:signal transduction histidine kinase